MFTHIFCESQIHYEMFGEYCDIGNSHVAFSGHPKMDYYMESHHIEEESIWKGLDKHTRITKIIYSPHWNFEEGYATFMDNGFRVLEYAESHQDTTSWIYKPHPRLGSELAIRGYMSEEEYEAYMHRWEQLPNARVCLTGDYGDIFMTSDCIINDSISFIAEYMYTHKPMLLLHNGSAEYNTFGKECIENVYTCKGDDIEAIMHFVDNVRSGQDYMKADREKFFDSKLNYYRLNGKLASEYIVAKICDMIGDCETS